MKWILSLSLVSLLPSLAWGQSKNLEIVVTGVKGSHSAQAGAAVLHEAYRQIGRTLRVRWETGKDGLELAARGEVHGVLQRIDGLEKQFPSLRQIDIPVNVLQITAFSWKEPTPITSWLDLGQYKVGIVGGLVYAEEGTKGLTVSRAANFEALFRNLNTHSIDMAICPLANGLREISRTNLSTIQPMPGTVETLMLYHYLHEDYASIAVELAPALKQLLLSGQTRVLREALLDRAKADSDE